MRLDESDGLKEVFSREMISWSSIPYASELDDSRISRKIDRCFRELLFDEFPYRINFG
jgi:hypothetical protein